MGFDWTIALSKPLIPLMQTKTACVMLLNISMRSRIRSVLILELNYVFLFCFRSWNFEFASYLKYFIEFEAR